MMTQSALLALPTPALPGGEARPLTPDQSAALPAATESFLSVMSQVRCDRFPKPPGEAKTSDSNASLAETPKLPANPSGKAGDIDVSMSSTLMAVMAQPRIAAGESRKSASTQAASFKNALVGQGGKALSLTEISDNDASPMETPKALANPPGKAPRIVTGEFHKPATTQAVNLKIAPAVQAVEARPLTETLDNDASPMETPKPLANPPGKAPRIAAGDFHKPASTQAANFKNASVVPGGKARPLTETSDNGVSPTETPNPLANPPGKAPRIAAGEFHKSASTQAANFKNASAGQGGKARPLTEISDNDASPTETPKPLAHPPGKVPRIAAGDFHKPATTQAVDLKIAPAIQGVEARPLTEISDNEASPTERPKSFVGPPVKAADIDASMASTLVAMAAQPQVAAGEFRRPASTRAVNFKITPPIQGGDARPLTETSDSNAFPTETPEPPAHPPDKAADKDASVSSKLTAVADQPQIAAGEFRKPASTQAVDFKIASEHGAAPVVLPSSSDSKPESTGPVPKTIDPRPAETSASTTEPAAHWAEPAGSPQQPVGAQIAITPPVAFVSVGPVDGTGGALSSQRMKFGTEKNEIAGPTAQKVPTAPFKDDLSTKSANDLMVGSDSDHSGHKPDSIDSALVMNWPAKASEWNVDMGKGTGAAQSVDHSAIQAERVGHLVNQQVVMIRQSGANNLAVSLKLDPHTELSLQLTNHNGQIEASVRWERGAVAGLENHWKDLQESLARQNVQLLPLENRASPRTPASDSASDTASASLFNQSSQNPQRHSRDAQRDLPTATTVKTFPVTNKATPGTASRQGWESWA